MYSMSTFIGWFSNMPMRSIRVLPPWWDLQGFKSPWKTSYGQQTCTQECSVRKRIVIFLKGITTLLICRWRKYKDMAALHTWLWWFIGSSHKFTSYSPIQTTRDSNQIKRRISYCMRRQGRFQTFVAFLCNIFLKCYSWLG